MGLLLQAMIIIAWSGVSILNIVQKDVLYQLSSIFITAACLRLLQSMMLLASSSLYPSYYFLS
jgi:callose synthase